MRPVLPTVLVALATSGVVSSAPPDFDREVAPVLTSCLDCHAGADAKGGFDLSRRATAREAVVPGDPAASPMWQRVAADEMPPKKPLTAAEKAVLKAWIEGGAGWGTDPIDPLAHTTRTRAGRDWWSFRPLVRPSIPAVADPAFQVRTPVDAFVLAKLREKGLTPSPEADRRTLIRRVYFDLIGLPPTFEEVEAFAADPDPAAYEKLVERLLASPRHGERWARHWLDVVRYGETHGYDKDKPRPNAWPYRDYVIRSLNADKPYGRFVREQVAGDVLFPGTVDGIEALGFLAAGPWDFIGHAELPETKTDGQIARHLDRDDFVSNTAGTFLSLTVHCAQCHDHKYDPITQADYYALQAVFAAIDRTDRAFDPDPAVAARRTKAGRLVALAAVVGGSVPGLAVADRELRTLPPRRVAYIGAVHTGAGSFAGTGGSGGKPRPIHILPRGDVTRPGQAVGPGAVAAVPGLAGRFTLPAGHPEGERRAALARWLTDPANPLTWRSMANRVWQHHFGRGIVDTPNDFGRMGQPPTHPELLDWLAAELRDGEQSLKRLHRLIVLSSAYRQVSADRPENAAADADNRYLWRQARRKLEAEAVRDSLLAAAGKLDLTMGGPSYRDFVVEKPEHSPHYRYQLHDPDDPAAHRRAVYRFVVRSQQQPLLAALDCADPSLAVDKRNQAVTPQQALALLNNPLAVAMAKHLAARAEKLGADDGERVASAVRLALSRSPTASERETLTAYAADHGLANACRVILNLSEFAFVD